MVSAVPPCELLLAVLLERVRDVSEQVSWLTQAPNQLFANSDRSGGRQKRQAVGDVTRSISAR